MFFHGFSCIFTGGVLKTNLLQLIFYRHLQKNFYDVIRIAVVMRHRLFSPCREFKLNCGNRGKNIGFRT